MKLLNSLLVLSLFALSTDAYGQADTQPKLQPVPIDGGAVTLSPKNSRIDFVGTHEGPKPDPRKGGFARFNGKASIGEDGVLESIAFQIDTVSLQTEIPKLTAHLKSPDFFDVRQHPKAAFQSSSVTAGEKPGSYKVVGKFTLLGTTKDVKIPVNVSTGADGMTLVSKFSFDRTLFGMNFGIGKVSKKVSITVLVGQGTKSASR